MDTANFFKRIRVDGPDFVILQIPLCLKPIFQINIILTPVVLHIPVVTVTGHHPGFIVDFVQLTQRIPQFIGVVKHPDIKIQLFQIDIHRFPNLQNVVDELDVLIAAVTTELRLKDRVLIHDDFTAQFRSPLFDFLNRADVLFCNLLVFVQ